MRALLTGAGGFVGAHLAARLIDDGWDVVGTIRPGAGTERLAALKVDTEMDVRPTDLTDPEEVTALARAADPEVAFLLAASRSEVSPADRRVTMAVNASSLLWLVDALPERCRTVLRVGSSTEYGALDRPMDETTPLQPRGFFGATKAAGSILLTAAAGPRRVTVLRPFQVYGPLDHPGRLVPQALKAAAAGERFPLTGPGRRRDWVFVDDVVEACVRAALADHLPPGQVLNIGTGRQVANEELVAAVARVSGRPVAVDLGAHPGCPWDTSSWVCNPSRAHQLLGWEAKVDLHDGLRRCWEAR